MNDVIMIGVDLAKNVFQVHGVDAEGAVIVRRQLRRGQVLSFFKKQPPCLIGLEACATSHHWAREIEALGHQVRLMPPRYVKPYVKRNENDMADAHFMAEHLQLARPVMGCRARLNTNQTGWQLLEKGDYLTASELSPDCHLTQPINAVDLKNMLRKIKADRDNFSHRAAPISSWFMTTTILAHRCRWIGAIHLITNRLSDHVAGTSASPLTADLRGDIRRPISVTVPISNEHLF